MTTFAIGDVQGCFRTFELLLTRAGVDPGRDVLWLAGDLVNRGPGSLAMLRWATRNRERVVAVLGNHDLHLLTRAEGLLPGKRRDTLRETLDAPDRAALLEWLATRPVLHREGSLALVHAGVLPGWTLAELEDRAREAEDLLRGRDRRRLLEALLERRPPAGLARATETLGVLTRVRMVSADGRPRLDYKGAPDDAPAGLVPWFRHPGRRTAGEVTFVFGHWAALGFVREPGVLALDTGCVWGQSLTAVRLDDGAVFQVPSLDATPAGAADG